MLLGANLASAKLCKTTTENDRNPGTWVIIWKGPGGFIQWIPTWQGLDGFRKPICVLLWTKVTSLSIRRVFSNINHYSKAKSFSKNHHLQGRSLNEITIHNESFKQKSLFKSKVFHKNHHLQGKSLRWP